MPLRFRHVALLVALGPLAACDSGDPGDPGPDDPGPDPTPTVQVFEPAPVEVAPDAETRIELTETFTGADGQAVRFDVQSVTGPIRATLDGASTLIIEPRDRGTAEVLVVRFIGTQRNAEATYALTVPEPAPIASPPAIDVDGGQSAEVDVAGFLPAGLDASTDVILASGEGPVQATLSGGRLTATADPVAEDADATLLLRTTRFVPRTIAVPVRVEARCPEAPPGAVDYFPFRAGDVWTFDLSYEYVTFFPDSGLRRTGIRTWTAERETCAEDVRTITVATRFEGSEERLVTTNGTSGWADQGEVTLAGTLTVTEDPTGRVDFYESMTADGAPATIHRYLPPTSPEVVDFDPYSNVLSARRGVGLERFAASYQRPFRTTIRFDLARR